MAHADACLSVVQACLSVVQACLSVVQACLSVVQSCLSVVQACLSAVSLVTKAWAVMALVASSLHRFLIGEIDCVGGLRNATIRCGCICVASDSSGALGPFTPVDPYSGS